MDCQFIRNSFPPKVPYWISMLALVGFILITFFAFASLTHADSYPPGISRQLRDMSTPATQTCTTTCFDSRGYTICTTTCD